MKKFISLILAVAMVMTLGLTVFADGATRDDYKADYEAYKAYYNDVYSPAYHSYNATLDSFAERITLTEFRTLEQAERVIGFLELCKTQRDEFFGDRETPGTSRYDVPAARNTMSAFAADGDYDSAIYWCAELTRLVELRVGFLLGLADEIDGFDIILPDEPDEPDEPETKKNGIEWLTQQLATSGTVVHDYMVRGGTTSLDSNGFNFAPPTNVAMLAATGLDATSECSWTITKRGNGDYDIYWSYEYIGDKAAGYVISEATSYNTKTGVTLDGTAVVEIKNVNVSGGKNADITVIGGFTAK